MSAGQAPYGPLRSRALVRAMPAMWCVGFSALGGVEVFHRAVTVDASMAHAAIHALVASAVAAWGALLLLFALSQDLPMPVRLVVAGLPCLVIGIGLEWIVPKGASVHDLHLNRQVAAELFAAFQANGRFFWSAPWLVLCAIAAELPFIGAVRRLHRDCSAESIDDALLLFGIGTVAHAIVFRVFVRTHLDVTIALVVCAFVGGWFATLAQSRRVARRRWLGEVARGEAGRCRFERVDDAIGVAPSSVLLAFDGPATFALVDDEAALDGYRPANGRRATHAFHVGARSVDLEQADLERVAPVDDVIRAAVRAALAVPASETRAAPVRAPWISGDVKSAFGCLAAIAIAGATFATYMARHHRTAGIEAEATSVLSELGADLATYAGKHGRFPESSRRVPATVPRNGVLHPASTWQSPPWSDLEFSVTGPLLLQYEIETSADGQRCIARARGDLTGSGAVTRYEFEQKIGATGEVQRGRAIFVTNEDE